MTASEPTLLEASGRRYSQECLLESDRGMNDNEKLLTAVPSITSIEPQSFFPSKVISPSKILKDFVYFLIPSFLSTRSSTAEYKKYTPNSTAWLDGLRGLAAFFVFVYHFVVVYVEEHDFAWDPVRHPNLIYLPILRLSYSGTAMVRLFFVISGFALTYKPVKLMRKPGGQGHAQLMTTLASSVFRRYLRLFLPCFFVYLMIHSWRAWGAFDWFEVRHLKDPKIFLGDIEKYPAKSSEGYFGQMKLMLGEFYLFAVGNPILHKKYEFETDKHLWTIPTEYVQSMSLFLLVAMLAHVKRNLRTFIIIPCCYGFWAYYKKFDFPLFLSGYFFAELHAALENPPVLPIIIEPNQQYPKSKSLSEKAKRIFWWFIVFIGLYLLSFPTRDGENTFGWITLCKMMGKVGYFEKRVAFQSYGASILVWGLLYVPRAQAFLTLPVFQYLGRISFSLYLMHGSIIRTMGHRLILTGWSLFPKNSHTAMIFVDVVVFFFAVLPTTIWLSDVFWRGVEAPCTNFVRYLETWFVVKEPARAAPAAVKQS